MDFDEPGTLVGGLAGVGVLVFVSAGYAEDDVVRARHGALIDAAVEAGVRHVVYTSLVGSAELLSIAAAHRWTERRLAAAPFDVTVLRNGLYAEIAAGLAADSAVGAAETGVFAAPFGVDGRLPVVARADLADAAVRVAADSARDLAAGRASRHAGRVYELEGTPIGAADLTELLAAAVGRPVRYTPVSLADLRAFLPLTGQEPYQVAHSVSLFSLVSSGLLTDVPKGDLTTLLGREPRPVRDLITTTITTRLNP
ncbi:NmrA family NAD(P)-binding protein [Actinocorallia sp. API 0066]|uniref:NmrA family NAD(P)-binding protein n=1 Tax=Actinocorallia sp. API 0066 TaxID=2896846 RepID=UPI001E3AD37F|nr:NmrA family NAD(P)-binding protein [Actinocorallia sp. API 0066]MCD0451109.1 NmrA family NAD(P)-binding protein [Actinocorallia sp. API 0066]